jgi:hypothetical protein
VVRGSEVAFDKNRLAALLLDECRDLLGIVVLFKVGDQNVGRANAMATALPIPLSPPVMMARLCFRRPEPL